MDMPVDLPTTGQGITAIPPPEPGIYSGIPEEEYHASPGLSVSTLKRYHEAPAKALVKRKETAALTAGSLIHTAVLEPWLLEERYRLTALDRRGTKAWDAEEAAAGGRELVKQADWDMARQITDAVQAHPIARELIVRGKIEVEQSAYWVDPETGLLCRGRADGLRRDFRAIVDLKSTEDASPRGFAKSCANYHYHWQDAYYREGFGIAGGEPIDAFVFMAVEKSAPYLIAVYEIDPEDLEHGGEQVREARRQYAKSLRTNHWPGYSESIERLKLPAWAAYA